jgi:DNA modification methylase
MKAGGKLELFDKEGKSRGYYSERNVLNNLTGREWVYWTKSVITKAYPLDLQHRLRSQHGGQKPPQLCADLIRIFTKEGETVLDPFAGVGGTMLGASLAGRKATGIEINNRWVDIYQKVCRLEGLNEQEALVGDSLELLDSLAGRSYDFVLTDVPYWRMDTAARSKGKYKRVGEKSREGKRSKLSVFSGVGSPTKEEWLQRLSAILEKAIGLLRAGRYLAVFIGDMYNRGEYHFLSADLALALKAIGLTMKANLTWYDVSKSLHIYGYQYEYIPSLIHQNILIFRRETQTAE